MIDGRGRVAAVVFAGLEGGVAGLYELNVQRKVFADHEVVVAYLRHGHGLVLLY